MDKGGGFAVMNLNNYLDEMYAQLNAKSKNADETVSPFYEKCDAKSLEIQKKLIVQLVEKGLKKKVIFEEDARLMQPLGKPNGLYGLPKVHKGVKEGNNIPQCRPIISNSGSNSEMISALVDHYSKHLVKGLKSYVQDFHDFLWLIESTCPQK